MNTFGCFVFNFQQVHTCFICTQNKPIFGFLRPDATVRCSQTVDNGILDDVTCSESSGDNRSKASLMSVLKFNQKSSSIMNDEDFAKLNIPTSALFNFTKSYSKIMEDNAVEKITQLFASLKRNDDSNTAEIYIELKKAAVRVSNLEQFLTSGLLK